MNKQILTKHIKDFIEDSKKNPERFEHDYEERQRLVQYYQSFTRNKIMHMTVEDVYQYISSLWAMLIWGNKHYVVDNLWSFSNPVQREKPAVKKVRFFVVGFRNNPLVWGKFAVYTNGSLYKGPQNTWAGYQAPGSDYYTLTSNPITSNPWTLDEIDALLAGEYHFDSGIPSRVGSYWYYLSIVYENASVRTDRATAYTGTTVTLHGAVTNTEGTFLDLYTPLGDNLLRVRFEWGETMVYGNNTAYQMGITGAFSANIVGLDQAKAYHYRAVVEVRADSKVGGFDVYYGEDMIFPSATGPTGRSIADRLAAVGAI